MSLLQTSGNTSIGGGTVRVVTEGGLFQSGRRYTILAADGGRAGAFDQLTESFLLLDMSLAYDQNRVFLDVVRNSTTLCSLAVTTNQCGVSTADVVLGAGNPVVDAVRSLPNFPAKFMPRLVACCSATAVSCATPS